MNKDEIQKILIATKETIATPDKWIKGKYMEESSTGLCFCLIGAINHALRQTKDLSTTFNGAFDKILNSMVSDEVTKFWPRIINVSSIQVALQNINDNPTTNHSDIIKLLDDAIYRLAA